MRAKDDIYRADRGLGDPIDEAAMQDRRTAPVRDVGIPFGEGHLVDADRERLDRHIALRTLEIKTTILARRGTHGEGAAGQRNHLWAGVAVAEGLERCDPLLRRGLAGEERQEEKQSRQPHMSLKRLHARPPQRPWPYIVNV